MERYEHDWIDNAERLDGGGQWCNACGIRRDALFDADNYECPKRLRSALDAALAELVDVREKLHIETCAGEVSEHERDAALAERDLLSTELRKSQEHTRLAMAERDALREKHARAARLFGLTELLTEPMECGHPIDCLPSHTAQEFREHPERIVCGWCAAEARAERAEAFVRLFMETDTDGFGRFTELTVGRLDAKARALLAPEAQRPADQNADPWCVNCGHAGSDHRPQINGSACGGCTSHSGGCGCPKYEAQRPEEP